jgi:hypothetical protein
MARIITSSSEYHSLLPPSVGSMIAEGDTDMKMMEEETVSLLIDKDDLTDFHFKQEYFCFVIFV